MANRWPPWIEAMVSQSALLSVTTTTPADVAGLSLVITPKIKTRALVMWAATCRCIAARSTTGFFNSILSLYLDIDGAQAGTDVAASTNELGWGATLSRQYVGELDAGTTYTLKIRAVLGDTTGGGQWQIRDGRLTLLGLPADGIEF